MRNIHSDLAVLLDKVERVGLVTIARVRGSAPREVGAKMVVGPSYNIGTIGGGQLEYECTKIAIRECLSDAGQSGRSVIRRFPLGSSFGQCCGGAVEVLFESITQADRDWLSEYRRLINSGISFVNMNCIAGGRKLIGRDFATNFGVSQSSARSMDERARDVFRGTADIVWENIENSAVLFERVSKNDFEIAVYGAGHVGSALVHALTPLQASVRWVDTRERMFPNVVPENVVTVVTSSPAREAMAMSPNTFHVIMTHSHPLDFEICSSVLADGRAPFCGLIGSLPKRRKFERLMRRQEIPDNRIGRLVCPIGIGGISGKRPEEIAVAVTAQLLKVREASTNVIVQRDSIETCAA